MIHNIAKLIGTTAGHSSILYDGKCRGTTKNVADEKCRGTTKNVADEICRGTTKNVAPLIFLNMDQGRSTITPTRSNRQLILDQMYVTNNNPISDSNKVEI